MKAREVRGVSRVVADHLPWRGDLSGGYGGGMMGKRQFSLGYVLLGRFG